MQKHDKGATDCSSVMLEEKPDMRLDGWNVKGIWRSEIILLLSVGWASLQRLLGKEEGMSLLK